METNVASPLQVLLESSAVLLRTSSQQTVLSEILDIAGRVLAADAHAVWRNVDGNGTWRAVATRGLSASYRTEFRAKPNYELSPILLVEDALAEPSLADLRNLYLEENIRSLMVAALHLEDGSPGTITFYWRQPRTFSQQDRDVGTALANLTSTALNQLALHAQAHRERGRLSFLAEASAVLSSSLDYETTLNRVAQLAVPHIADWCVVHVVENGVPNRIVVAHADPAMLESTRDYSNRYPEEIRDDRGIGYVLRTGKTEVYPNITDEMLVAAARDEEHLAILRSFGMRSSILVPLVSRDRVLGAVRLLAAGSNRYFTQEDVQLAEDLARRAAAAIENAQLHRAVVKQQEELRLAHEAARMGSWHWDLINNRIAWSEEFKGLHDLPPGAAPNHDSGVSLIHPEDRDRVLAELDAVLHSGKDSLMMEHRAVTGSGRTIFVQSRGTITRDAAGNAVSITGITMDVTESRRAEDALRRTEKLAAAGRLAATVAHEVNNPLESLTNLVFIVRQMQDLPASALSYLDIADREINRMAQVVRQTLGFYRESASARPVDVGTAVEEIAELYRTRAEGRGIQLTRSAPKGLTAVMNEGELKQVIANLLANAIDATPAGSVNVAVHQHAPNIVIEIADTGTGIPEQAYRRLFEPFFTTKADVGTGLGLWVSKGIVEKYNGSIRVHSSTAPGSSGTRIYVTLPAGSAADHSPSG